MRLADVVLQDRERLTIIGLGRLIAVRTATADQCRRDAVIGNGGERVIFAEQAATDFERLLRREAPQQDFGEVVQQGGQRDFLDVHVQPLEGPVVRVARGALHAADDVQDAEQGLRLATEGVLDGVQ